MPGFSILNVFLVYRACLMRRALYICFSGNFYLYCWYTGVFFGKLPYLLHLKKRLTVFPVYSVKLNHREILHKPIYPEFPNGHF